MVWIITLGLFAVQFVIKMWEYNSPVYTTFLQKIDTENIGYGLVNVDFTVFEK